ncbi:MAG: DoxX family protein [Acidobacteriia bacterium]|jgi:putative oxidoreductase|nr:DoxX family protein [Terriglobia bacterium]
MTFPELSRFLPIALLLMRLMVGAIFITSGWSHVSRSEERAKSIGMSKGFTAFLGLAELAGGLGVVFGVLTQLAALGLILLMLGAIYKKIAVWHTGFWGEKSSGWHYELMLVIMNLVIIATNGGPFVLMNLL